MSSELYKQVMMRLNKISRSSAFLKIELDWLEDASKSGMFKKMSRVDQNEYMDTLYQINQSDKLVGSNLKDRAGDLYSRLKKNQ